MKQLLRLSIVLMFIVAVAVTAFGQKRGTETEAKQMVPTVKLMIIDGN